MKASVAFACALFAANALLADPYSVAIQQAKRVSKQETQANERLFQNPPPAAPARNSPNQPVNPVLEATLKNIHNLQNDFAALARLTSTASVTTEKQSLTNDLTMAATGKKPSPQSLEKLADDLTAVVVDNDKLLAQHLKLAQYVHASCNGSQLTDAQQQLIITGTQKILIAGGAKPEDAAKVVNDLKTIASETK